VTFSRARRSRDTLSHLHRSLCCLCGAQAPPTPSNLCATCLRSQVDITEGVPRELAITWCARCNRWLQPPRHWAPAELESKELLQLCLARLRPRLKGLVLADAGFVWTEVHSRRLKVKLAVQKEIHAGTVLQQILVCEFTVEPRMCLDCNRAATTQEAWRASVQLRQKVRHKRTFLHLEQLILKHQADATCISVVPKDEGLDFHFRNRSHATRLVNFLRAHVPCRHVCAKQLVSHDTHTAEYNYKYTFAVEIAPVCRDDLICLPRAVARAHGGLGPLVLCTRVGASVTLTCPRTLRQAHHTADQYWRHGYSTMMGHKHLASGVSLFSPLCPSHRPSSRHLTSPLPLSSHFSCAHPQTEFVVVDVEVRRDGPGAHGRGGGRASGGSDADSDAGGSAASGAASLAGGLPASVASHRTGASGMTSGRRERPKPSAVSALSVASHRTGRTHLGAGSRGGGGAHRLVAADAVVCRPEHLGLGAEHEIHTRTHLGAILRPGDTVLGYDVAACTHDQALDEWGGREGAGGKNQRAASKGAARARARAHGAGGAREGKRRGHKGRAPGRSGRGGAGGDDGDTAMDDSGDDAGPGPGSDADSDDDTAGRRSNRDPLSLLGAALPDIVLVRKSYKDQRAQRRAQGYQRPWKLRQLQTDGGADAAGSNADGGRGKAGRGVDKAAALEEDREWFYEEIEEDPELRKTIDIYADPEAAARTAESKARAAAARAADRAAAVAAGAGAGDDDRDDEGDIKGVPEVPLSELLDALAIEDVTGAYADATAEAGADGRPDAPGVDAAGDIAEGENEGEEDDEERENGEQE